MVQISLIKIPLVLPVFFFSFFCASFFLNIHFLVVLSNTYNSQSNFQLFNQLIYQKFYVTDLFFFFLLSIQTDKHTQGTNTHRELGFDRRVHNSIIYCLRKTLKYWNAIFNHSSPSKKRNEKNKRK